MFNSSPQSLLTIALITYNQADKLAHTLNCLAANRLDRVEIIVLDNNSSDQTSEVAESFGNGLLKGKFTYVRHRVNVGAGANILRCFEHAASEWIWILGDDEPIPDAVNRIVDAVGAYPQADYINFATSILDYNFRTGITDFRARRQSAVVATGLREFINRIDCFANLIFISSGLYRVDSFREHVQASYGFINTMVPQLTLILLRLRDNPRSTCVFSNVLTVIWKPSPTSWSYENYCNHVMFSLEALPTLELRRLLFHKNNQTDALAPSFSLRKLWHGLSVNDNISANNFKRYATISVLTGAYNRPMIISYLCSRLLPFRPFKPLLKLLVDASKKPIPFFGRYLNRLLDLELGVPQP